MSDTAAWGMVALVAGLTAVAIFGIPWAIIVWRGRVVGRLRSAEGTLDQVEIVQAGDFADLAFYYAIEARYRYTVDGQAYAGDRIALEFNLYRGEAAAREVLAGATAGGRVTVWYDSANPKRAVLDNSRPASQVFFASGAIIGAAIAIGGAIGAFAIG